MIIIIEDSCLHPKFPILAWLLLATSKGYTVTNQHLLNTLINIVRDVATVNCRDDAVIEMQLPSSTSSNGNGNGNGNNEKDKKGTSLLLLSDTMQQSHSSALIRSLLCRQRFGGMGGDMEMLKKYANVWYHRLEGNATSPPTVHIFQTENTISTASTKFATPATSTTASTILSATSATSTTSSASTISPSSPTLAEQCIGITSFSGSK